MTFLAGILASVIEWAIAKLVAWGVLKAKEEIKALQDEKKASADAQALKDAKTDEQKKAALDSAINNTFSDS